MTVRGGNTPPQKEQEEGTTAQSARKPEPLECANPNGTDRLVRTSQSPTSSPFKHLWRKTEQFMFCSLQRLRSLLPPSPPFFRTPQRISQRQGGFCSCLFHISCRPQVFQKFVSAPQLGGHPPQYHHTFARGVSSLPRVQVASCVRETLYRGRVGSEPGLNVTSGSPEPYMQKCVTLSQKEKV